jgi:hypothetical protein
MTPRGPPDGAANRAVVGNHRDPDTSNGSCVVGCSSGTVHSERLSDAADGTSAVCRDDLVDTALNHPTPPVPMLAMLIVSGASRKR